MDQVERVLEAVGHFGAGDTEAFIACFSRDACVYAEPHVSSEPLACGHDELRDCCERLRRDWGAVTLTVRDLKELGDGVVGDVLVMAPSDAAHGGWRFAAAVKFAGGLIAEVRPYWRAEAATAELLHASD